jgi:ribosomal protein S18 acetylase RimI-like enzyme
MLYVDAANAAAVGLYTSMGLVLHHVDRAYATPAAVAPAGSPAR